VQAYCGNNVFAIEAPKGTHTPYIAITESDSPADDDGFVYDFTINIEVYDYSKSKRPLIRIGQHIKRILDGQIFQDVEGTYSNIRIRFAGREPIRGDDPTLSYLFLRFTARACENNVVEDNN
jgi:hypothetical protein